MQNEDIKEIRDSFEDAASEYCLDLEKEAAGTSGNTYKNEITELHWVMWNRAWYEGKGSLERLF